MTLPNTTSAFGLVLRIGCRVLCGLLVVGLMQAAQAKDDDGGAYLAAYTEMLPNVAYSATRVMNFSGEMQLSQTMRVYYTPRKERAEIQMDQASGMNLTTLTLYDEGVMWTLMGPPLNNASSRDLASLNESAGTQGK